jgi:hypothetical protein
MSKSAEALASRYRAHLEEWARVRRSAGSTRDIRRANKLVVKAHAGAKRLKATPEGQAALAGLLNHPDPGIRAWIATEILSFDPTLGCAVLEEIRDEQGPGAFDAGVTLEEFEAGRLNVDW